MACTNENAHAPNERLMRLKEIIGRGGVIPVSKSTWWAGVRSGRFPPPIKLSAGITVWRASDLEAFIAALGPGSTAKRNPPGPSRR